MTKIVKLTDRIRYLQMSYEPLSADVVAVRGDSAWWIFDVGACDEAVDFINALPRHPVSENIALHENGECAGAAAVPLKKNIVISHFHRDHLLNVQRMCGGEISLDIDALYVGAYTSKTFGEIEGVAKKFGMTPQQLVIINDKLNGVNQFIYSGMELNVTYFDCAINVIVEKEKFVSEVVYQPAKKYETDPTMAAGQVIVLTKGRDGKKNTLYQEIYVNGVLTSYKQKSTTIVVPPVQEVVRIGAARDTSYIDTGEKNFRLPVDNCYVMCGYGCYYGHRGTDFANQYEPYGKIYACESGVVTHNSYQWDMGWFYCIDHGDGFWFRYLHMSHKGPIPVGTTVIRSQYIGDIGMTGSATAPHVHIDVFIGGLNGNRVNPCTVLPC